MILHTREHVDEVLEGVDPARFAGGHQRVQARDTRSALDVVDEEVVLAAEGNASERALGAVVVERHPLVVEKDAELLPLVVGVADRRAHGTLWGMTRSEER